MINFQFLIGNWLLQYFAQFNLIAIKNITYGQLRQRNSTVMCEKKNTYHNSDTDHNMSVYTYHNSKTDHNRSVYSSRNDIVPLLS